MTGPILHLSTPIRLSSRVSQVFSLVRPYVIGLLLTPFLIARNLVIHTHLILGKFLSIPTQLSISTGPASPSVLLQFPIPPKRAPNSNQAPVPSVVQLMVTYDPTASRGTHVQFGSLDPHVNIAETLDGFRDQVDEVVRRAGPLAAVGWLHAQLRSV